MAYSPNFLSSFLFFSFLSFLRIERIIFEYLKGIRKRVEEAGEDGSSSREISTEKECVFVCVCVSEREGERR